MSTNTPYFPPISSTPTKKSDDIIMLARYKSPKGAPVLGVLERVQAIAEIEGIDPNTGAPEYSGWTEIFWDLQEPVGEQENPIYLDENGEKWPFNQLVLDKDQEVVTCHRSLNQKRVNLIMMELE